MTLPTWQIAYRHHDVMNPSSPEKILRLGERLRLDNQSTVLDLCAGTAGPAVLFARRFGCRVTCVDFHEPFLEHAHRRATDAGVSDLITLVHQDAAEFMHDPGSFTTSMCLGAAGALGGFEDAAIALRATVPIGGHVVIGDLYRHDKTMLDPGDEPPEWLTNAFASAVTLDDLLRCMVSTRLAPVVVLPSSEEDWMTYSSLMWQSIEDWFEKLTSRGCG